VSDDDLKGFDYCYKTEHLVDALIGFGSISASREWGNDN
jgi:hypothetical protein